QRGDRQAGAAKLAFVHGGCLLCFEWIGERLRNQPNRNAESFRQHGSAIADRNRAKRNGPFYRLPRHRLVIACVKAWPAQHWPVRLPPGTGGSSGASSPWNGSAQAGSASMRAYQALMAG